MSGKVDTELSGAGYAGGASGAREAARREAYVVVVDAFRASATIAVLVARGARVIPLASIEEAARYPADVRVGERDGARVSGFDFGNSPTEIIAADLPPGLTVAMSTTNGTRVVEASHGAREVLAGSFVNAGAVSDYLVKARADGSGTGSVIVGCGWRGKRSSEDEAGAGAILKRLAGHGVPPDARAAEVMGRYLDYIERPEKTILRNSASRRLRRLGYESDIGFCLTEDIVPVVPVLRDGAFTIA